VGQFRPYLLATVSSSVLLTGAAIVPAVAQPQFTWTGFYIGLNAGAGSNGADFSESDLGGGFYFSGNPNYWNSSDWGATAGALAGYNWQSGNFVFGVEGDMNWLNGRDNATLPGGFATTSTSINWYGTARARIGFVTGSPLHIYLTGGVAVAEVSNTARRTGSITSFNVSDVRVAPVFGAGFEYRLAQNTTFRVEGLFADFGDTSQRIFDGGTYKSTFANTLSVVRGAVTWAW
jgi:outer membrane immunogenic protein